jgi:trigger factor
MAYSQMRTQAERDVRGAMLLEMIGEKENVEVTENEVDEEIGKMAEYYRTTADEVRKSFENDNGLSQIQNNLKTRKAIEALISKAKITEGSWVDESVGEPKVEKAEKPKKTAKKKADSEPQSEKPKAAKKKTAK